MLLHSLVMGETNLANFKKIIRARISHDMKQGKKIEQSSISRKKEILTKTVFFLKYCSNSTSLNQNLASIKFKQNDNFECLWHLFHLTLILFVDFGIKTFPFILYLKK